MTAAEAVLGTVELLDMILLCVIERINTDPWQDVFRLQMVNKTFYNHVNGGTRTAQALHLMPEPNRSPRAYLLDVKSIIRKRALRIFDSVQLTRSHPKYERPVTNVLYIDNPIPDSSFGSWANLLLSQPPLDKIWIRLLKNHCNCPEKHAPSRKYWLIDSPEGLTLGRIAKFASELLAEPHECAERRCVVATAGIKADGSFNDYRDRMPLTITHKKAESMYRRIEFGVRT